MFTTSFLRLRLTVQNASKTDDSLTDDGGCQGSGGPDRRREELTQPQAQCIETVKQRGIQKCYRVIYNISCMEQTYPWTNPTINAFHICDSQTQTARMIIVDA